MRYRNTPASIGSAEESVFLPQNRLAQTERNPAVLFLTAAESMYMNESVPPSSRRSSGMETASLIIGIFSLIMIATGSSVIIGSIGIILALLSRGADVLSGKAKAGLCTSLIGIIGGIAVTLFAFSSLFSGDWTQAYNRINSLYQTYITDGSLNPADLDHILQDDTAADQTALVMDLTEEEEGNL